MVEPYYQDSNCTIYNADCAELLSELGRFDLLLTDPPYGIGEDGGAAKDTRKQAKERREAALG